MTEGRTLCPGTGRRTEISLSDKISLEEAAPASTTSWAEIAKALPGVSSCSCQVLTEHFSDTSPLTSAAAAFRLLGASCCCLVHPVFKS